VRNDFLKLVVLELWQLSLPGQKQRLELVDLLPLQQEVQVPEVLEAMVVQVVREAPVAAVEAWEVQVEQGVLPKQAILRPLQVEQRLQLHLQAVLLLLREGWEAAAWLAVVLVAVADVLLQWHVLVLLSACNARVFP